jgi:hypothetical protein
MTSREDQIATLARLDPASFEEVVSSAYRQRRTPDDAGPPSPPDTGATPEQFARWLAGRHMSSDLAIEKVVYLPVGAPAGEIRLLEVNRFLNAPEPDAVEPLDFTPDTDPSFKVFVADVTGDQWERIQRTPEALLPVGWALEGNLILGRG